MKKYKFILIILGFSFLILGCSVDNSKDLSFDISFDTQKYILPNNFSLINRIVPDTKLVSIDILVRVGSAREQEFLGKGMSHFVEHMLFKANKVYQPGEIHKLVRSWGGNINGFTSYDYTRYRVTVLKEHFEDVLILLGNMFFKADFTEDLFLKEKDVILNEIKFKNDNPEYHSMRLAFRTAYSNHPYSVPILGYESKIKNLNLEELKSFYKKYYVPSNMIMSVVGFKESEEVLKLAKKHFLDKEIENFKQIGYKNYDVLEQTSPKIRINFYPTDLVYLNVFFQGVDIKSKDLYALDILAFLLGRGSSSRLNKEINFKKGLVNWVGAFNYAPKDRGLFNIYASTDNERLEDVIKYIFKEIEKIKQGNISNQEIKKVINRVKSSRLFGLQTVQSQAQNISFNEFLMQDYDFDFKYIENLKKITKADLKRVANKYLDFDRFNITLILPDNQTSSFIENILGSDLKDNNLDIDINVNSIEELFSEKPEKSLTRTDAAEIKKHVLDNNLTVLLGKDDSLPIVSVRCLFLGGVRAEHKDNIGISKLTSSMLLGGTKKYSKIELLREIEDLGGGIGVESGYNTFSIGMSALSSNLDESLEVLFDIIKNSEFPLHVFQNEKTRQKRNVLYEQDDIFQIGLRNLRLLLYNRHPYKFKSTGTLRSIENISRDDVVDFYNNMSNPDNMVIAIIGDINPDKVISAIDKNLGVWRKNADFKDLDVPDLEELIGIKVKDIPSQKQQNLLMYGFRGIDFKNQDRYALEVLTQIISGGGSRLWQDLREKRGLAYALGAYFVPGIEPGYYSIYILTQSRDLDVIKDLIEKQIALIKKGEFLEEEILLAKKSITGSHLSLLQDISSLTYRISLDYIYGLGYNNYKSYQEKIMQVEKEDILRVANKYLDMSNYVIVRILQKEGQINE